VKESRDARNGKGSADVHETRLFMFDPGASKFWADDVAMLSRRPCGKKLKKTLDEMTWGSSTALALLGGCSA
jgi:hypothetical protein